MANLNAWQKINRVVSGRPFGNGSDGAYSSATIPTMANSSCSGTAASSTLSVSANSWSNGSVLLVHQSRGTGVGQWEINGISSGGGTTTLTTQRPLNYTYTDSGASQAQVTIVKQYTDVTVQSGTWNVSTWSTNVNGILCFAAKGDVTVTGTISANGDGYAGGARAGDPGSPAAGEGGSGLPGSQATGAGQGGGNGTAGSGGGYGVAGTGARGGSVYGSADLTSLSFGGGGSGASANPSSNASAGAKSGGAIFIFAKNISGITGGITATGDNSANTSDRSGGGGSGGAVLIVCSTATLGTNKVTAGGGTAGTADSPGTAGGVGRIAVHHFGAVTGTTSPTYNDTADTSLIETDASILFGLT